MILLGRLGFCEAEERGRGGGVGGWEGWIKQLSKAKGISAGVGRPPSPTDYSTLALYGAIITAHN